MLRRGKAGVGADPAVGKPAAVVAGIVELLLGAVGGSSGAVLMWSG